MEIDKALSQISEIHAHVARAEVYRDVKALPVVLSGLAALVASGLEPRWVDDARGWAFILYWLGVATLCALMSAGGILRDYVLQGNPLARRRTRTVVGQFAPCLGAGALVTLAMLPEPRLLALLPGLWSILFSLGIFAARPYLPRMIGYGALYHFAAGGVLLALAHGGASLNSWGMGLTFGLGQILTGLILYWNLERGNNHG